MPNATVLLRFAVMLGLGATLAGCDDTLRFDYAVEPPQKALPKVVLDAVAGAVGVSPDSLTYPQIATLESLDLSEVDRPQLGKHRFAWLELFTGLKSLELDLIYHWAKKGANTGYGVEVDHAPKPAGIDALGKLHRLETLSFTCNAVQDLAVLKGLKNLRELTIETSAILNMEPLREIASLRVLRLGYVLENNYRDGYGSSKHAHGDLSGLAGMTQLEVLDLSDANGGTVDDFGSLTNLRELRVPPWTHDLTPVQGLSKLRILDVTAMSPGMTSDPVQWDTVFGMHQIEELHLGYHHPMPPALAQMPRLKRLYVSEFAGDSLDVLAGCSGLEVLHIEADQVTDLGPLAGLSALRELQLSAIQVNDIQPLAKLTGLEHLKLYCFQVVDGLCLKELKALKSLYMPARLPPEQRRTIAEALPGCEML